MTKRLINRYKDPCSVSLIMNSKFRYNKPKGKKQKKKKKSSGFGISDKKTNDADKGIVVA